jgi:alpha-tubulin suppressor-like RCC1 family protein
LGGSTFNSGVTFNNQLTLNSTSLFQGGVSLAGGVTLSGQFTTNSTSLFQGGVTFTSGITSSGQFTTNNTSLFIGGSTFITNGITMSDNLTVQSTSLFQGGVTFGGGVTFNTTSSLINNSTTILRGGVTLSSGVTMTGQLTSNSTCLFQGGVTFASIPTIDLTSNQLLLNNTTLNAPSTTIGTYNIPDVGMGATFVMTEGTQTIDGSKTFSSSSNVILAGNAIIGNRPVYISGYTANNAIVYSNGELKIIGNNISGQFGIGSTGEISTTNPTTLYSPIGLTNVYRVAFGGGGLGVTVYALAVLNNGDAYGWGDNSAGQLGLGYTSARILTPTYIMTGVTDVACGNIGIWNPSNQDMFSLFLMNDGTVKSCGGNSYGQLGQGNTNDVYKTPTTISSLSGVKQITAGSRYAGCILSNDTARTWGSNNGGVTNALGVLGQNLSGITTITTPSPVLISAGVTLTNVKKITASSEHTLFLTNFGNAHGCGSNFWGQLAQLAGLQGSSITIIGATLNGITSAGITATDIIAYRISSAFLLSNKTIRSTGFNSSGQLGYSTSAGYTSTPTVIPGLTNISFIPNSNYHNYLSVIREDGKIFSCGQNNYGNLGNGVSATNITSVIGSTFFETFPAINFSGGVTFEHNIYLTGLTSTNSTNYLHIDTATNRLIKTGSSQRYKTDILDIPENFSDNIHNLRPVSYKFIADSFGITNYGLIAEEVNNIYPDLVCKNSNNEVESIKYEGVSILLLHNYQKSYNDLNNIETQMQSMQTKLVDLQNKLSTLNP